LAGAWGDGAHLLSSLAVRDRYTAARLSIGVHARRDVPTGFAKLDEASRKAHAVAFADLTVQQQDELLALAEHGKLDFGALPSAVFFGALLDAVMEGFFSDPIYGGNRDKIGWKLVGFPGVHAELRERHSTTRRRVDASRLLRSAM
jgi:gluconate 2-dehydrogenase gamma chain